MNIRRKTSCIKGTVSLSFDPTLHQLHEIGSWLQAEEVSTGEGFFCNWNAIQSSYNNNRLLVLLIDNMPLGFITWYESGHIAKIQLAEIKPSIREMGYGRIMTDTLFEYFLNKDILIAFLHCQPFSSEKIWKKLGFVEFPVAKEFDRYNNRYDKHLYKILFEKVATPSATAEAETIELWDSEPSFCKDRNPSWTWNVKYARSSSTLLYPIIHVGHRDWKIRWKRGNAIVSEGKVKYFGNGISFGDFIIIEKISEC